MAKSLKNSRCEKIKVLEGDTAKFVKITYFSRGEREKEKEDESGNYTDAEKMSNHQTHNVLKMSFE